MLTTDNRLTVYDKFNIAEEDRPQRLPSGNAGSRPGTHSRYFNVRHTRAGAGKAYILKNCLLKHTYTVIKA